MNDYAKDSAIRNDPTLIGQAAYEASLAACPQYQNGDPQLSLALKKHWRGVLKMPLKLYLSPQARETATISYLRNPVVPTGRTRRRWFFLMQYEYEGPVYVARWQTPFNMERWPRRKYWSCRKPLPGKPRVRVKCASRHIIAAAEVSA
ncbi:hypothetical protein IB024_00130 [Brucella sp. 6810]|uniref:hypothetical protein n=1 Tax=Brucella sp. 6810 TaxID=2769351 RepID=UPI00165BDD2C|nr:hypothetical protein [Brucella sp. 6810]QNQ62212.1 hypothetical protein IB024_00130 [Brucella sp. 6810]